MSSSKNGLGFFCERTLGATILLFGLISLGACSSDDGDSQQPTQGSQANVETWCGALCGARKKCDNSYDDTTCLNSCRNTNAAIIPKLRSDVINIEVDCFGKLDCATVMNGQPISECGSKSAASVAPSQKAQSFCSGWVSKAAECGGEATEGTCLTNAKVYSDSTLQEAQGCLSKSCSDTESCVGAALGS